MDRRELLKLITLATGSALIGGELLFTACSRDDLPGTDSLFSGDDLRLLDEIAETILPRTHTPGASDADVASFMAKIVDNCYFEPEQQAFMDGLARIREESMTRYNRKFGLLTPDQKTEILQYLDREALEFRRPGFFDEIQQGEQVSPPDMEARESARSVRADAHFFTMMKQLAILGYFTSETVQTGVLRHVPIPGRYDGCIPYEEGDTAWAI